MKENLRLVFQEVFAYIYIYIYIYIQYTYIQYIHTYTSLSMILFSLLEHAHKLCFLYSFNCILIILYILLFMYFSGKLTVFKPHIYKHKDTYTDLQHMYNISIKYQIMDQRPLVAIMRLQRTLVHPWRTKRCTPQCACGTQNVACPSAPTAHPKTL